MATSDNTYPRQLDFCFDPPSRQSEQPEPLTWEDLTAVIAAANQALAPVCKVAAAIERSEPVRTLVRIGKVLDASPVGQLSRALSAR